MGMSYLAIVKNPTGQKLFEYFMRFRKLNWWNWHGESPKPSDVRVLFCIKNGVKSDHQGMMVSEISSSLHVSSPTVTQLVKNLEASGQIERTMDEMDRRVYRVRLTDSGEATCQHARDAVGDAFEGLIAYLGEDESEQLAELLFKVFQYYSDHQTQLAGGDSMC